MVIQQRDEDSNDECNGYIFAMKGTSFSDETLPFGSKLYEGRLKDISLYQSILKREKDWLDKTFKGFRHQVYEFFLRDGFLWM